MAKVRPVFQETAFQSTAFQDQAWGLAAFQANVFQGVFKNQYAFQNNAYQNNVFTDRKYTIPAVFDTIAVLIKIINETIQSTEDKTKLRGLVKLANESISVQSFRHNLRQLIVHVSETMEVGDSRDFAKTRLKVFDESLDYLKYIWNIQCLANRCITGLVNLGYLANHKIDALRSLVLN